MRCETIGLALCYAAALGCAGTSATPIPSKAREKGAVFYVEHQAKDHRSLHLIIVGALQSRGLEVTTGHAGAAPENVDYLVSYVDRWGWDMRTYLADITIEVRDTERGVVVAKSRSFQDSIGAMGHSYEGIVTTAANRLLDGDSSLGIATEQMTCDAPYILERDCTPGLGPTRAIEIDGVHVKIAGSSDGRVIYVVPDDPTLGSFGGDIPAASARSAFELAKKLDAADVGVVKQIPVIFSERPAGYVLELDRDGYTFLTANEF